MRARTIGDNPSNKKRAAALVLVLGFVALLAAMVIAFFATTTSTGRETAQYGAAVAVKQLADAATNLVMGQILDATKSWEIPASDPAAQGGGARLTFATQPGLIRTYDDRGRPWRAFKLYSSATMVTAPGTDWMATSELSKEVPSTWAAMPALYTDINAPALKPDPNGSIRIGAAGPRYSATYPILNPSALASGGTGIEGFDLQSVPGYGGPQSGGRPAITPSYNPMSVATPGTTGNPAPMPVQWIYMLQDGTLTSPSGRGADGTVAEWSSLPDDSPYKPKQNNPIVGRIAFWADDETCKLNINTASEGVFWDRPWAVSSDPNSPFGETQLIQRSPVKGEYQRYPGHPATVCLSPVLGGLLPEYNIPASAGDSLTSSDYDAYYKRYYDLLPRIRDGGSRGGSATGTNNITPDQNRLFSSVDELLFAPPEGPEPTSPSYTPNRSSSDSITSGALEKANFFLTAYNRAPEINAFGRPRISLWQLQQENDPNDGKPGSPNASPRNVNDKLLAFCSTINSESKYKFYFQRYSIYLRAPTNVRTAHPTIPFMQLPEYGFAPPSSQDPALDWTGPGMERNRELYRYLQSLTSTNIPGWGAKITDKYPSASRDQILTQMIDLIRAGTNGYAIDPKLPPRYEYAPARGLSDAASGETQIVPLIPPDNTPGGVGVGTKGFGRFPVITEAALIFYATASTDGNAGSPGTKMRALLVLQPYSPTAASWTWSPLVRYVLKDGKRLSINNQTNLFRDDLTSLVTSRCGYGSGGEHHTAYTGIYASFRLWNGPGRDQNKNVPATGFTTWNEETDYPFVSDEIDIDPAKESFDFGGGEITVEVHSGYALAATDATKVQTFKIKFPPAAAKWPIPRDSGTGKDFNRRIPSFALIDAANDTVRSVQIDPLGPARGDLRYVASLKTVTSDYFAGYPGGADGPGYDDATARVVHSLRNGNGGTLAGGKFHADLVDGTNGSPDVSPGNPIAARGMRGAKMVSGVLGDYDNGANRGDTSHQDGAYINKPDDYYTGEGNATNVTPNRQVCSPVMFGSLPAGGEPWRTLLFCPYPAGGRSHPGFRGIRDHAFLDFFTMPVIEPYAISEPFSTGGKVNLNYQIAPFTYITRSTALRGILKSTRVMAIPNSATNYKSNAGATIFRREIDRDETIAGFEERFGFLATDPYSGEKGMFRSASEICDMYLVPKGATLSALKADWWRDYAFTGDNAREFPYSHIYPRVTTKSNTFTVHFRVQSLARRKGSGTSHSVWREGVDNVAAEYRGSTLIERYLDTADPNLPDFAVNQNATVDGYYRFRVLTTRRFNP